MGAELEPKETPAMTRDSLIALGLEFRRLGMQNHVEQLASYYRSGQGHRPPYAWSDAHVEGWLKRLRIPPYQDALPVRPKGSPCPECGPGIFGGARTFCSFPGGAEFQCDGCKGRWLEVDGPETTIEADRGLM